MPTFIRSAMNPNGTWQSDGMDQSEAFNASRNDSNRRWIQGRQDKQSQSDIALQMLREQLGLQREMYQGGREDSAATRQAEADRWGKQFDYMGNRDKSADSRWREEFDQNKEDRGLERNWRLEQEARDTARYDESKPLRAAQLEMTRAELAKMQQQQTARNAASGASVYTPQTEKGRDAYTSTIAVSGDPLQAGYAAKSAEREQAMSDAEAEAQNVGRNVNKFAERDASWFSSDPTEEDMAGVIKQVEAMAQLYRNAGMSEPQIRAKVQSLLTENGKRSRETNAGWTKALLERFGIQQ